MNHIKLGVVLLAGMITPGTTFAQSAPNYTLLPAQRLVAPAQPDRRVTLDLTNVPIADAIHRIASQTGLALGWSQTKVPLNGTVTISLHDVPVREALQRVLRGTAAVVKFSSDGETIMIVPSDHSSGNGQTTANGSIVGWVTDSASGRGLGGATVQVQGTTLKTVTADSGQFTLRNVPVGDQVLSVRLFGHRPVTRTVTVPENAETSVRIVMAPTATVLSGMVTTATGTQRKLEVGNDITTLNVDSLRQVAPITSVTDLLESRVPGLTVLRSSGVPGDPARLRLRGAGSINGNNDPIVIVDGIRVYAAQSDARTANLAGSQVRSNEAGSSQFKSQSPIKSPANYAAASPVDQIDPNSIETIEVLKGPSASSLYGSDAANGVIVITTKRGRVGPTHWTTNVTQGLSYLPGDYPIQTIRWGHDSRYVGAPLSDGGIVGSRGCDITDPSCDVIDSVTHLQVMNLPRWSPFGHGNSTSGSVNVSGGASALTYALTGSAGSNLGYLRLPDALADAFQQVHGYAAPGWAQRPDKYTTWGGNGQLTVMVGPAMQLTLQSNLFHSLQQRSSLEEQLSALASTIDTTAGESDGQGKNLNAYERATSEQLTFNNAVTASWAPWAWLPLTGTAGLNVTTGHDVTLLARDIAMACVNSACSDTNGYYGASQKSSTFKTFNLNTIIPGWRGRLRTALGFNIYAQSSSDFSGKNDTLLAIGVNTPSSLTGIQSVTGTATYGWFFEPRFTLSQRFFVTPGFRLDGGTANGGNASVSGLPSKLSFAALFPKLNFSFVALDRQDGDAPPLFGVLTLIRPRLALGSAGVQPSPEEKLRLLAPFANWQNNQALLGSSDTLLVSALGNTQLRPERSFEVEGGVDAEAWHNRASLKLTHARKTQHDAIIPVTIAPSVYGGGRISVNIGEIRNTNTELEASVRPLETPLVSWTIGGNLSRNDNKVLRLDPRSAALANAGFANGLTFTRSAVVGYPLFGRWARPILGYGDANEDGIIQASEIRLGDTAVYVGRQDPAYTAAINTDVSLFHGRLGVHANFSRSGGYSQVNGAGTQSGTFLSVANDLNATLGQQAGYVAAVGHLTPIGLAQTVSAWRFQSLSVNYAVPTAIAQRFHAPRMSVALQGSNLGLWTNYKGKDPNVNAFPNGNSVGDGGQVAQPRTWSLLLTLGN